VLLAGGNTFLIVLDCGSRYITARVRVMVALVEVCTVRMFSINLILTTVILLE